jgi:hypothetical protein
MEEEDRRVRSPEARGGIDYGCQPKRQRALREEY